MLGVAGCSDDATRNVTADSSGNEGALVVGEQSTENTGEAEAAMFAASGVLCEIGCQGAATASCAAVALACTSGTIWTYGSISIPCQYAVVAACYAVTGAGVVCSKLCNGA